MKKFFLLVSFLSLFGLYSDASLIACTMEYMPVCGVDGATYGNKCGAQAAEVAIAYTGECKVDLTNCTSYYDGCNTCFVNDGKIGGCTKMACVRQDTPKCLEYKDPIGMPNPASINCKTLGGALDIRENTLGQYGVCTFDNGVQCEEWALMNGKCTKENSYFDNYNAIKTKINKYFVSKLDYAIAPISSTIGRDKIINNIKLRIEKILSDKDLNHKLYVLLNMAKDSVANYKY